MFALPPCLLVLVLCLGGCASTTGIPRKPWNQDEELKSLASYLTNDVVANYNRLDAAGRTDYRNAVAYARIRAIDITYSRFVEALAKEKNLMGVSTDTSVLLLSGTAALMTPESTKSILAAISGGVVGIKGSIDKNLFYDKTMPALLTQMDALRKQRLAAILSGLGNGADQYSLTQLLIDLEDYFQAGTIPYAITAVNAQGGAAAQKATEEIKGIKLHSFTYGADKSSESIRTWLLNGGTAWDAARRKTLNDWLQTSKIEGGITAFLNTADFKEERTNFINETKIPTTP